MTRAILVSTNGDYRGVQVNGLDDYQRLVGGYIEHIELGPVMKGRVGYIDAYINEEGKLAPHQRNVLSPYWHGVPGDYLAGAVLLVGPPDDEGNDTDVSEWVVEWVRDQMDRSIGENE